MGAKIMLAAMGAMTGGTADGRPVTLVTEPSSSGVTVQVVGNATERTQATYTLEISSGASGGNRSVQRGSARLEPGKRVVLLTAHLGGSAGAGWKARLNVHSTGHPDYEIARQAD